MNEELQKELAAWLASMRDGAQQGMNFALEQAPLVVQEKVLYGRIGSLVGILACVCLIAACVLVLWRISQEHRDDSSFDGVAMMGVTMCGLCILVSVVWMATEFIPMALKSWFAPRLYVLEWLAEMLK